MMSVLGYLLLRREKMLVIFDNGDTCC